MFSSCHFAVVLCYASIIIVRPSVDSDIRSITSVLSSPRKKNRGKNACNFGPLFFKTMRTTILNSMPTFILRQGSLWTHSKDRSTTEQKLLNGYHCLESLMFIWFWCLNKCHRKIIFRTKSIRMHRGAVVVVGFITTYAISAYHH
jgi:hypothetical protein